jgi:ABC-type multidrug transport system fused ATPase/permease subunit
MPGEGARLRTVHGISVRWAAESAAKRRAGAVLRDAVRIRAELETILAHSLELEGQPLEIWLADGEAEAEAAPPGAVVHQLHEGDHAEPLAGPLTRQLIARGFGPAAADCDGGLITDGLARMVATRTGGGPSLSEATAWVRQELAARPGGFALAGTPGAAAFVAHLLARFGTASLRRYLEAADSDRREHAALAAFNRPLSVLEETWLNGLRRWQGSRTALRSFLGHLWPLLTPYRTRLAEYLLLTAITVAAGVALPLGGKFLVDTVIPSRSGSLLAVFLAVVAALFLLSSTVSVRRAYVNSWINQHLLNALTEGMFQRLQQLSHAYYVRARAGDVTARLQNDVNIVFGATSQVLGAGIDAVFRTALISVTLLALNAALGALVIAVLPLLVVTALALRSRQERNSLELQRLIGEKTGLIQEAFEAQGTLKAFGLSGWAVARFRAMINSIMTMVLRIAVLGAITDMSSALAVVLGQLLVFGIGGWMVIHAQMTVGTLLAFIGLLGSLFQPVQVLVNLNQMMQRASGGLGRMIELLDEPLTIEEPAGAVALGRLQDAVRLERVTFGYGTGRAIVQDLDIVIPAGRHVAVAGPSGSGKSTVASLLLRFWDPEQGRVLFDGVDIRGATLASLRDQVGVVFQDTFIFDTTLRENIALGRPDASDGEIEAAARGARLDAHVDSLPEGYETVLGERGVRLSGGQKQRIAIARVLLRDPPLLILDEATSALDTHTERGVLETLDEVARGRTVINITHRLSVAAEADTIFVLEQGRIVEQGGHAELLARGGSYQRLWEEQQAGIARAGQPVVPTG